MIYTTDMDIDKIKAEQSAQELWDYIKDQNGTGKPYDFNKFVEAFSKASQATRARDIEVVEDMALGQENTLGKIGVISEGIAQALRNLEI